MNQTSDRYQNVTPWPSSLAVISSIAPQSNVRILQTCCKVRDHGLHLLEPIEHGIQELYQESLQELLQGLLQGLLQEQQKLALR
jgi:hypothetical protein